MRSEDFICFLDKAWVYIFLIWPQILSSKESQKIWNFEDDLSEVFKKYFFNETSTFFFIPILNFHPRLCYSKTNYSPAAGSHIFIYYFVKISKENTSPITAFHSSFMSFISRRLCFSNNWALVGLMQAKESRKKGDRGAPWGELNCKSDLLRRFVYMYIYLYVYVYIYIYIYPGYIYLPPKVKNRLIYIIHN